MKVLSEVTSRWDLVPYNKHVCRISKKSQKARRNNFQFNMKFARSEHNHVICSHCSKRFTVSCGVSCYGMLLQAC